MNGETDGALSTTTRGDRVSTPLAKMEICGRVIVSARALLECRPRLCSAYCYLSVDTVDCAPTSRPCVSLDILQLRRVLSVSDGVLGEAAVTIHVQDYVSSVRCVGEWECSDRDGGREQLQSANAVCVNTFNVCVTLALDKTWCAKYPPDLSSETNDLSVTWTPVAGHHYDLLCAECHLSTECADSLLTESGGSVVRCLPLPSDNWCAAMNDAVCCCAGEAARRAPVLLSERARARLGDVLTASGHFVLADEALDKTLVTTDRRDCVSEQSSLHLPSSADTVKCRRCGSLIGDKCEFGSRVWRHCVVWRCTSAAPISYSPLLTRRQLMWRLLCERLADAPVKLLVTSWSLTAGESLLLHIIDPQLLPVQRWAHDHTATEQPSCPILYGVKLLYRRVHDSSEFQQLSLKFDVDLMNIPVDLYSVLLTVLCQHNSLMPASQRSVTNLSVGLFTP